MPEPIDLKLLQNPPVTPNPGLSVDDPDKSQVTFHFDRGEYEEAGRIAAAIFTRRVFDLRMLPALYLGAFVEGDRGVPDLAATLGTLVPLLGKDLPAFGPEKRRAEICDASLAALFSALRRLLEFHDKQRDTTVWSAWVLESDEEVVDGIVNACAAVSEAAKQALPEAKSVAEIGLLGAWFNVTFRQIVARQSMLPALHPDPPPAPPPAKSAPARRPTRPPPAQLAAPIPRADPEPEVGPTSDPAPLLPAPDTLEIKASPALKGLLQKLQAFEILVARGELQKAAVVANDLEKLLAEFDPKVYLPGLLSSYFAALSAHIDDLSPHLDAAEGRGWQALAHFYQVDLEGFVKDPAP